MKNLKALLGLDFKLCMPYWKWWVMFLGISLLMGLLNRDGGAFIITVAIFTMTVMVFPFEVTDKSNLDVLYATLPSNRKSMVVARYGFFLLSLLAVMLVAVPIGIVIHAAFGRTFSFTMFAVITVFSMAIYLVCVGIQTPFMYKYGYKKGRIFMWIPLIAFVLVINLNGLFDLLNLDIDFNIFEILFRNALITTLVSLGVGVFAFVASFLLSRRFYLRKDL